MSDEDFYRKLRDEGYSEEDAVEIVEMARQDQRERIIQCAAEGETADQILWLLDMREKI